MTEPTLSRSTKLEGPGFLLVLAGLAFFLHLPFLSQYGLYGDEFYFLACGERLAFGFADHPPLVPAVAALAHWLAPDSVLALRVLPCLAGAATIFVAALLCRDLGGGSFAQALTALCIMLAPAFLRMANILSLPSFESFFWTLLTLILLRILRGGKPSLWLLFGFIAGLGLLNKHTILFYGGAATVALLLTSYRRCMSSRWIWLGGLIAFLVFLPNLVWQMQHDWVTINFVKSLNAHVMSRIGRDEFLIGQILYAGPGAVFVWIAGLVFLLRNPGPERVLGLVYVLILALLLITKSKIYYSMPLYPMLFAAGAVFWESLAGSRRWTRLVIAAPVVILGLAMAPLGLPILPIDKVDAFAKIVTGGLIKNAYEVTGDLHSMFGWREQVDEIKSIHAGLPPEERKRVLLLVSSYSKAGAVEHYGRGSDLPPVLCNHLSYHYWSRSYLAAHRDRERDGSVVLAYGFRMAYLEKSYAEVLPVGRLKGSPHANRWERNVQVYLCRRPRDTPLAVFPKTMGL